MPLPIGLIAPLILGGGLAAKEVSSRMAADRREKLMTETIPQMIATINAQQMGVPLEPVEGAQEPTKAPKAPKAEAPEAPPAPEMEEPRLEEIGLAPGETTDLPILPMRDLQAQAPFTVQGYTVDESGNINFQIKKDQSGIGAEFHQMFQNSRQRLQQANPGMAPLELDTQAINDAIHRSSMLPPKEVLDMLDPAHRNELSEQIYWSAVNKLIGTPEARRSLVLMARNDGFELSAQAYDAATTHYALRTVTNDMGGFIPEDVREQMFNLEGPPLGDDEMREAFRLFGVTHPSQVTEGMLTQIQSELKKKQLGQVYDEKLMQGLASEEAQAIIEQRETGAPGAGPVGREVRKRATLAETAPISPKDRAQLGVPADIKTYLDVVKKGMRLLTPKDKENVDRIESIVLTMDQLQANADKIFTSEGDYYSRIRHGLNLKWEVANGTDLGIAVQNYQDQRETVVRLLLELVGESGGRFTDKDMQQIQKAIPEIEGLIGDMLQLMPEGKKVAGNKFANMDELLFRKLSFIKTPQMVKMEPEKPKFRITKDKKLEKK